MATSTAQAIATVPVWDYLMNPGDGVLTNPKGLGGKKVKISLTYSLAQSASPVTLLGTDPIYTDTDPNGFWQVNLVPNNKISPGGTLYSVSIEGYRTYLIQVTDVNVPGIGWQSVAIAVLPPISGAAGYTLPGGTEVLGALTVDGALIAKADVRSSFQTVTEGVLVSGIDASLGQIVAVTLTANRVVGLPLNPFRGQRIELLVTQNATGGWTLTWPAGIRTAWQPVPTANSTTTLTIEYDGANWQAVAGQAPVSNLGVLSFPGPIVAQSFTATVSPYAPGTGLSPGEGATAVNPFNIKAYNAKGDGISRKDGAITSGLAAFTSATGTFTAADVGKLIIVVGAGAAGAVLATTIASFTSATAVGLTATAGTTVTGAEYAYGTDNATAIAAAFTAAGAFVEGAINSHVSGNPLQQLSGTVTGPAGTFMTSAGFRAGLGVSVVLDPNCVIKAGALIAGPLLDTSATVLYQEGWIQGGQWDCSDLALNGIYIRQFAHCSFKDFMIQRPRSHYLIFGDPAAAASSFEPMLMNVHLWRPPASAVPAGSYGLWIQNCTDAKIAQLITVGADAGIRVDTDVNHFWHCHAWGYPTHVNTVGFDDNGNGNIWLECFADTASTYGWRLRQAQAIIIGGQVYNGPSSGGADNVLVGIHSDAGTGSFEVMGMRFAGSDGTHRIKIDIEGDRTNCHIFGCVQNNVVTANSYDQTPSFYPTLIDSVQQIHVTGKAGGSFPGAGAGIEMTYDSTSGTSYIQSYDRGGAAAKFLNLSGSLITLGASSIASNDFRRSRQTPSEAVLVSGVTATAGELVGVTLTAARVVGAPISPSTGQRLTFNLVQGGAGAFAVTWNAAFKGITGGTSGATGTRASFSFDYDGTNWNLNGAQPTWVA